MDSYGCMTTSFSSSLGILEFHLRVVELWRNLLRQLLGRERHGKDEIHLEILLRQNQKFAQFFERLMTALLAQK